MKRDPRLQGLSRDHHHALILARDAARMAEEGTAEAVEQHWRHVQAQWNEELEPHFRLEEEVLLPAMEARGEQGLVTRTRADHAAIRDALYGAGSDEERRAHLRRFATLLRVHVEFEERELFESAQEMLDDTVLTAVWERSPRREAG